MIKVQIVKQRDGEKYLSMWGWGMREQALRFNTDGEARDYANRTVPAAVVDVVPYGVELERGETNVVEPWAKRA